MTDSRLASSFVQARLYRVNPGRPLRVVTIHDMEAPEGPRTAENCAAFFAGPDAKGSAHYCVDTDSIVQSVREADQAAHAPGANTDGIGIELCGYARQTRDEWLDDTSMATMRLAAALVADICARTGIPARWLSDNELADPSVRGLTTHAQVSRVFRRSDHTDPGAGFPADLFLPMVLAAANPTPIPTPTPGGSPLMALISTLTFPQTHPTNAGCGIEFRAAFGTVVHRWQDTPGGKWRAWEPVTAAKPPFPVDSVDARVNLDGSLEILAWASTAPQNGAIRAWQKTVSGEWAAWAAA